MENESGLRHPLVAELRGVLETHASVYREPVAEEALLHHHVSGYFIYVAVDDIWSGLGARLHFFVPGVSAPVLEVDADGEVVGRPGLDGLIGSYAHVVVVGMEKIVAGGGVGRMAVVDGVASPVGESLDAAGGIL